MTNDISWDALRLRGRREGDCLIWTRARSHAGYGRVRINRQEYLVHRLALSLALGRPLAVGAFACHTCDVPACFEPTHLYEGTAQTNMDDARARRRWTGPGPRAVGESHAMAKLTEADVHRIRSLRREGWTAKAIAAEIGGKVSRATVSNIYCGNLWVHLPEQPT